MFSIFSYVAHMGKKLETIGWEAVKGFGGASKSKSNSWL